MTGAGASVATRIVPRRYVDSVVLMRVAQQLGQRPGVVDAAAVMATPANRALLADGGFGRVDAGPDDLVVAVRAADDDSAQHALEHVDALLAAPSQAAGPAPVTSIEEAVARQPGSNLAVITVPGEHAAAEARRALELGLHAFVFSSNVALDDEVALKRLAAARGLLCMGPDCGTAILAGVGVGFANVVRRGSIGIVGASGTGIQAVSSMLDRLGAGVSHAIGAGTRDVTDSVGGSTMLAGLRALVDDVETRVIILVAKPPDPATAARLRDAATTAPKPVVVCFLGAALDGEPRTLDEAARQAARLAGVDAALDEPQVRIDETTDPSRRWVRGLYAGGTLGYEAQLVLRDAGLDVASNAPLHDGRRLLDANVSDGHCVVDFGSEELTRGRPHPMIDSRLRAARLRAEGADPSVAVILFDVVLGHGAAADPVGDLAEAIASVRGPRLVASVCGTAGDPQDLVSQEERLRALGVHVVSTNAAAARAAAASTLEVRA